MTDREIMQQALDALKIAEVDGNCYYEATELLRTRLAQPEQELVCDKDPQGCWNVRCQLGKKCKNTPPAAPAAQQEPVTPEAIRAAGGIVHKDGNVFFTNLEQLNQLVGITGEHT